MTQSEASRSPSVADDRSASFRAPTISLPQGGGAIRGIDEKFAASPATGAGTLTVPIATSKGRSGFGLQLALTYGSSGGNGPFGFGWTLALPSITRRTDKGLPRYADDEESDIFILSGSEDLVPVLVREGNGGWIEEPIPSRDGYAIKAYRPRTEGLFARIERWTRLEDGDTHWRSIAKDNVLTVYGLDAQSRIADPRNPKHVFSWLICRSFDDKGNAIVYDYAGEDGENVDLNRTSERDRERTANRYIRRIRYGNRVPLLLDPASADLRKPHVQPHDIDGALWMFSLIFDYGEGRCDDEADEDGGITTSAAYEGRRARACRRDPFSSYRSGFEIRTYRLCRRALMYHHFPDELGVDNYLVRSTSFEYNEKPIGSFLAQVKQSGHTLQGDARYLTRSLPALDLSYTSSALEDPHAENFRVRDVDEEGLRNLPSGIDGEAYRFLDLDGVGVAGVLTEQDQTWFYKPNLGSGRFGATEAVQLRPALAGLSDPSHRLMDIAGDGKLDLVDLSASSPGVYERNDEGGWEGFRAFRSLPVLNWNDPNLRFVDVTGDGVADILITEDDAFKWHPSLLNEGFGAAVRVRIPLEEGQSGPRAIFADGSQSIYLANMTGDGLSDIVRIRNGEVCYWPNRGYGRFGAKITMDRSPWFDTVDTFDQRHIRLADTDGSGTSDILYLGHAGVEVFLNESGNAWSSPRRVDVFPTVDNFAVVEVLDLLGRGTACLVWSSPLPGEQQRQLRYLDLMCGRKPHLLCRAVNNAGAETRVDYASSTEFYLADQAAGTPWVTRLPFPVQVVKRIETYDEVSRSRFVSRYTYHHGFYDGLEREFRGFGRVDKLDTEDIAALMSPGAFPTGDNVEERSSVPPVLTKTWIHTGVFLGGRQVSRHMAHEYFPRDDQLDDTILPAGLGPYEAREACRALKGSTLRQEVYALDGSDKSDIPYTVTDSNFTIRTLQPLSNNRYAVFFAHPRETLSFHYERELEDPRCGHTLTLAVDDYGNVLRSASIGYARRRPAIEAQDRVLATLSENQYTNPIRRPDAYRAPLPSQQSAYQLTAPQLRGDQPLAFDDVEFLAACAATLPYDATATGDQIEKRLIERRRTLYRSNDLEALLPLGWLETMALPGETYRQALTAGLLGLYHTKATPDEMRAILHHLEYRDLDGDGPFWVPSGRVFYSPHHADGAAEERDYARRHFYLPHRFRDPFRNTTAVAYDEKYKLLLVRTRDAVGNETASEPDYRVLQPRKVTDPNGNRTEARFDALGMLVGTALMGKAIGVVEGDSFDNFVTELTPKQTKAFFEADDPYALASEHLGTATSRFIYDLGKVPMCAAALARETHVSDLAPGACDRVQLNFVYSDGFGREAQRKVQAEPGPLVVDAPDSPFASPRWVGSGAKIYNNKGKPVREYEPFFSSTPHFGIERWGVSNVLFYDPPMRVVATLHPNHTFEKVVFDPWQQVSFDANDTVTFDPKTDPDVGQYFRRLPDADYLPTWYQQRIDGGEGPRERESAIKASAHANTPTVAHFDTLGRTVLSIADNGGGEYFATRTVLDIEGHQRAVIDALDRVLVRYDYDMAATRLRQASMDAGERWTLNDVGGKPARAWNSRGFAFRTEYDSLRRPARSFVSEPAPEGQARPPETLFERTVYGDGAETGLSEAHRKQANLLGKPFRHFDDAGVATTDRYDFKGNPLSSARRFARDYRRTPDWSRAEPLESRIFSSATKYDALNRAIAVTAPDGSVYRPKFNDANLIEAVDVNLRGVEQNGRPVWTPFITFINYDAKGQRTICRYGNRLETRYAYDKKTFRLGRLTTTRAPTETGWSSKIFKHAATLQELVHTYDPVGNIIRIECEAAKTAFHANQKIDAACDYAYDPTYRLIEATGREHIGQSAYNFFPQDGGDRDYPFEGAARLGDLQALQRYVERYDYDPAGNILAMFHHAAHRNWTRAYAYGEASLLEPEKPGNRLSETGLEAHHGGPVERYAYDANGNMTRMPHLPLMEWNYKDQLAATSRQAVTSGEAERTYYVYDAGGQRARKVTEDHCGDRRSERFYVGGFEVFREYSRDRIAVERETLHVMDGRQRIAMVETAIIEDGDAIHRPTPTQRYQLANHLGSASVEVDEAGGLISYEEYSPYGNSTYQAGVSASDVRRKRYRYIGKERDEENGLYYCAARFYAPWLGRWTSADPKGVEGGLDLYAYAAGNPVTLRDPSGRDPNDKNPKTDDTPKDPKTDAPKDPTNDKELQKAVDATTEPPTPPDDGDPNPSPVTQASRTNQGPQVLKKGQSNLEIQLPGGQFAVGGTRPTATTEGTGGTGQFPIFQARLGFGLSPKVSLHFIGTVGSQGPESSALVGTTIKNTTPGSLGGFVQIGTDQDTGFGAYLGAALLLGQNPDNTQGNFNTNALLAYSLGSDKILKVDLNLLLQYQHYGSILSDSASNIFTEAPGINFSRPFKVPGGTLTPNLEYRADFNEAANRSLPNPTDAATSVTHSIGVGLLYSNIQGHYSIGINAYGTHEQALGTPSSDISKEKQPTNITILPSVSGYF